MKYLMCTHCGIRKPPLAFHVNKGLATGRNPWCKECRRVHKQTVYARCRAFIDAYKLAAGCMDCGLHTPPQILEFDHVEGQKSFTIGEQISGRSPRLLLQEMGKCEVVCANCHRIRTINRRSA